jgi:hypothetical protein
MPPTVYYKARVLHDLFRNLVVPCVATALILRYSGLQSLGISSIPPYVAAMALAFAVRVKYADSVDERNARKLNARLVPRWDEQHPSHLRSINSSSCRVVGKLPGNIDVMLRLVRARRDRYLLDGFFDLFHEYKTTTLNLRFLWQDKVLAYTPILLGLSSTTAL